MIKLILIDDHRLFSDGLCALLTNYPDVVVAEQVFDSEEAFRSIKKHNPDVILLDFNMPGLNGMDIARKHLARNPDARILLLTMYSEIRHMEEFRAIGVKGYMLKTAESAEVVAAIRAIHEGRTWFPAKPIVEDRNNHSDDFFLKTYLLTPRELVILRLIKQGFETVQISDKLNISRLTVETHRKNMCVKLNLRGRNELLRFAIENEI